jgi:hypothetical protein
MPPLDVELTVLVEPMPCSSSKAEGRGERMGLEERDRDLLLLLVLVLLEEEEEVRLDLRCAAGRRELHRRLGEGAEVDSELESSERARGALSTGTGLLCTLPRLALSVLMRSCNSDSN